MSPQIRVKLRGIVYKPAIIFRINVGNKRIRIKSTYATTARTKIQMKGSHGFDTQIKAYPVLETMFKLSMVIQCMITRLIIWITTIIKY